MANPQSQKPSAAEDEDMDPTVCFAALSLLKFNEVLRPDRMGI